MSLPMNHDLGMCENRDLDKQMWCFLCVSLETKVTMASILKNTDPFGQSFFTGKLSCSTCWVDRGMRE